MYNKQCISHTVASRTTPRAANRWVGKASGRVDVRLPNQRQTRATKDHDSPSGIAQAPLATGIPAELPGPKASHSGAHTPAHLQRAALGEVGLQRMFYFGSSVGFVALLCRQTGKQVANIKRYGGAVTRPSPRTHTRTGALLIFLLYIWCLERALLG